jgi:hypothetical protein
MDMNDVRDQFGFQDPKAQAEAVANMQLQQQLANLQAEQKQLESNAETTKNTTPTSKFFEQANKGKFNSMLQGQLNNSANMNFQQILGTQLTDNRMKNEDIIAREKMAKQNKSLEALQLQNDLSMQQANIGLKLMDFNGKEDQRKKDYALAQMQQKQQQDKFLQDFALNKFKFDSNLAFNKQKFNKQLDFDKSKFNNQQAFDKYKFDKGFGLDQSKFAYQKAKDTKEWNNMSPAEKERMKLDNEYAIKLENAKPKFVWHNYGYNNYKSNWKTYPKTTYKKTNVGVNKAKVIDYGTVPSHSSGGGSPKKPVTMESKMIRDGLLLPELPKKSNTKKSSSKKKSNKKKGFWESVGSWASKNFKL